MLHTAIAMGAMAPNPSAESSALSIGELSQRAGTAIETIRYYERIGLLPPAARTAAGRRFYTDADVRRLGFIRRARAFTFSLAQIRQLLAVRDRDPGDRGTARSIVESQLLDVRTKIADLARIEQVLGDMVTRCQPGIIPECPILDALHRGAPAAKDERA